MRVDREVDFHGWTRLTMRSELDRIWATRSWDGLSRVRIIHGTGDVLWRELDRWCEEKGIASAREAHGGATLIYPGRRTRTPPLPAHRPLARLPRKRPETPLPPTEPPAPEDAALFARAVEELSAQDASAVLRRKRSTGT